MGNRISNNYKAAPEFKTEIPMNLSGRKSKAKFGSDMIVQLVSQMGTKYIFLTPGSSFRGVHDSLVNFNENKDPKIILVAHEEMAVAMAQGYWKVSRRPGMAFLHDLVGLQHAVMALYNAMADRAPLIVLGGAGPMDPAYRRKTDWIHTANAQSNIVRDVTKWTDEPTTLQAILDSIARAQRIATSAPCSPTYVSVDAKIQEDKIPNGTSLPNFSLKRYQPPAPIPAPKVQIEAAVEALIEAQWPMIFGGRIGYLTESAKPMKDLVERTGSAYQDGHDIVCMPSYHPQNLNCSFGRTEYENDYRRKFLEMADTILCVDCLDISNNIGVYQSKKNKPKELKISMTLNQQILWLMFIKINQLKPKNRNTRSVYHVSSRKNKFRNHKN